MSSPQELPTFETLFGELDFKRGDDARTVYSPAAYLTDLAQLVDDSFQLLSGDESDGADRWQLLGRRPDLRGITLDEDGTYGEVAQLDIVNRLLQQRLAADGVDAYELLKSEVAPSHLPLDFDYERVKMLTRLLGVDEIQLDDMFAKNVDLDGRARQILGLSETEAAYLTTERSDDSAIASAYRFDSTSDSAIAIDMAGLPTGVTEFMTSLALSGAELRMLLFLQMSENAKDELGQTERSLAGQLFPNHGLGGHVGLDSSEQELVWISSSDSTSAAAAGAEFDAETEETEESVGDTTPSIPPEWYDRVDRLVRLARKCGFSLRELELALRSCCGNQLDVESLQVLAAVRHVANETRLDVDVVCAMASSIETTGLGDEGDPADLFNRVFNEPLVQIDNQFLALSPFTPPGYASATAVRSIAVDQVDWLKSRIGRALRISAREIDAMVEYFTERAPGEGEPLWTFTNGLSVASLPLVYRLQTLGDALDLSITELLELGAVLDNDAAIRTQSAFGIALPFHDVGANSARILDPEPIDDQYRPRSDVKSALWLIQAMLALRGWMNKAGASPADLTFIQRGVINDESGAERSEKAAVDALNTVLEAARPHALTAGDFIDDRFDVRSAGVLHEVIIQPGRGLVERTDSRLVTCDEHRALNAARDALRTLSTVQPADFDELGLGSKIASALYRRMVARGVITDEHVIDTEALSKLDRARPLTTDFEALSAPLFDHISALAAAALDDLGTDNRAETADDDADMIITADDLETIADTDRDRLELLENLVLNGHVDDAGRVTSPTSFAHPANRSGFSADALWSDEHERMAIAVLEARVADYTSDVHRLDRSLFADLDPAHYDIDALLENLEFNDVIDETLRYLDPLEILETRSADFNLAVPFYPVKDLILSTIQDDLRNRRDEHLLMIEGDVRSVADSIASTIVWDRVDADHLVEGRLTESAQQFFANPANTSAFELGFGFDQAVAHAVFNRIVSIQESSGVYALDPVSLAVLGLDYDEVETVIEMLIARGHLTADRFVTADHHEMFAPPIPPPSFHLADFEDVERDVFFALHNVVVQVETAMDDIVGTLRRVAASQEVATFDALAEALGADRAITERLTRTLLSNTPHPVSALVAPIFTAAGSDARLVAIPRNRDCRTFLRRLRQLLRLVEVLRFDDRQLAVALRDQNIVEKFSETLRLPDDVTHVDALLDQPGAQILLFSGPNYWRYDIDSDVPGPALSLWSLSPSLGGVDSVDASFVDADGRSWIIADSTYVVSEAGSTDWTPVSRQWGRVRNNLADGEPVDAAFTDREGVTYLFSGDQYIRYSSESTQAVDAGYPKSVATGWRHERPFGIRAGTIGTPIDAAFETSDGQICVFQDDSYGWLSSSPMTWGDDATLLPSGEIDQSISADWGRVRNNLANGAPVDAAYTDDEHLFVFAGDQVVRYSDQIENDDVTIDNGFPLTLGAFFPGLPHDFERGLDAAFRGADGSIHLAAGNRYVRYSSDRATLEHEGEMLERWGRVTNPFTQPGSTVDAAFVGLDGCTYLFSGERYVRYSGRDYTHADEGYPRRIASDWGGITSVAAALVLDGKTYLFEAERGRYVCYSTNDYTMPDDGYPQPVSLGQWWNLPESLTAEGFDEYDAALVGPDGTWYLFSGDRFVAFDQLHRWWSEPQPIESKWIGFDLGRVDAGFTGPDNRVYLFGGDQFVRYSDHDLAAPDDRYPRAISQYWGQIVNQFERTRRMDAAVVIDRPDPNSEGGLAHTYLFCAGQYIRYTGSDDEGPDDGYPRSVRRSLADEPGFESMTEAPTSNITTAFVDDANMYVASGDMIQILANPYGNRERWFSGTVGAAVIDEGSLFVKIDDEWNRISRLESRRRHARAQLPPALRDVPEEIQSNADAVLLGTDGNTYVFKDDFVYNISLERTYPIATEWGSIANSIRDRNQVDAAFIDSDGRLHVFGGDQSVSYRPGATVDADGPRTFVEGFPTSIPDRWGGLENVDVAFVSEGDVYLLERPDANGEFRLISYPDTADGLPKHIEVQTADFSWWGIPDEYREHGFDRVDAALSDDDNLILIRGREFVQFHRPTSLWTHPKPVTQVWTGLSFDNAGFDSISAAFRDHRGKLVFFATGTFVEIDDQPTATSAAGSLDVFPIRDHWGLIDNDFATGGHVDAAFVSPSGQTFVFAGDQYIRYSTADYRHVDEGYPMSIAGAFGSETLFDHVSPDERRALDELLQEESSFDAIVMNQGAVHLFHGRTVHTVSLAAERTLPTETLGRAINRITERSRIDAALTISADTVFVFAGDQAFRYSHRHFDQVDDGYPRDVSAVIVEELGFEWTNDGFDRDLDAATVIHGSTYLFKGTQFIASALSGSPATDIADRWGRVDNEFANNGDGNVSIDAAFVGPDQATYLVKGRHFLRYENLDSEYADEGFPQLLADHFGSLPSSFEQKLDAAFSYDGRVYLSVDDMYVRYSGSDLREIDHGFPHSFDTQWRVWGDLRLADLEVLAAYRRLHDERLAHGHDLTELVQLELRGESTPYERLSAIFGWDVDQTKWIKRHPAFLPGSADSESRVDLETIIAMDRIFRTARIVDRHPEDIHRDVWQLLYDPGRVSTAVSTGQAADHLTEYLLAKSSESDRAVIQRQLADQLNVVKRDAWVPLVIARDRFLDHPNDLSELLLIDVQMGHAGRTSLVKEAIAALQLYVHRFFLNLEPATMRSDEPGIREQLRERWKWLRTYRLWEANRKIFLYPENYIRPELRDTRTPQFRKLEEVLLQGDLDASTAEAAYVSYLESFEVVGNLKIVGANVYTDTEGADGVAGDQVVMLFGRTRMEPHEIYHRTVRFSAESRFDLNDVPDQMSFKTGPSADDAAIWSAWEKVEVAIVSDRVFPIHTNGRTLVFWIEIEDIEETDTQLRSRTTEDGAVADVNTDRRRLRHIANIKYSLRKLDGTWSPGQTAKPNVDIDYKIDAAYNEDGKIVTFAGNLCMKTDPSRPEPELKRIEEYDEFENLPTAFHAGLDSATIFDGRRMLFKDGLCAVEVATEGATLWDVRRLDQYLDIPAETALQIGWWNWGAWNGGQRDVSILAAASPPAAAIHLGVEAAFGLNDDILMLVDRSGTYTFFKEDRTGEATRMTAIQDVNLFGLWWVFIITVTSKAGNFSPANAVFERDDIYFVLRDGQYECYQFEGLELKPLDGFPKPIRGNLSFNMDRFYNRLHLSPVDPVAAGGNEDSLRSAGPIRVSYSSPRSKILLYGQLNTDMSFEELLIQNDHARFAAVQWDRAAHNLEPRAQITAMDNVAVSVQNVKDRLSAQRDPLEEIRNEDTIIRALSAANTALREALSTDETPQEGRRRNRRRERDEDGAETPEWRLRVDAARDVIANLGDVSEVDALLRQLNSHEEDVVRVHGGDDDHLPSALADLDSFTDLVIRRQERNISRLDAVKAQLVAIRADMPSQFKPMIPSVYPGAFSQFTQLLDRQLEAWQQEVPAHYLTELAGLRDAAVQSEAEGQIDAVIGRLAQHAADADGHLDQAGRRRSLEPFIQDIESTIASTDQALATIAEQQDELVAITKRRTELVGELSALARNVREFLLGTFDVFPPDFGIPTVTNFAFSEPSRADWHVFESNGGTFMCRPLGSEATGRALPDYQVVRLTTGVIPALGARLFAAGVGGLLSTRTQGLSEKPKFGVDIPFDPTPTVSSMTVHLPDDSESDPSNGRWRFDDGALDGLDFYGAGGTYYSELFFHAPFLIANALNAAQKFSEAREWYEYIFDPTMEHSDAGRPWRYLPFHEELNGNTDRIPPGVLKRHLDDPFDPFAIADLRPAAYRKAIVMAYIDNVIDWADVSFRRYTAETINEARMLYTFAYDLLGDRPEQLGTRILDDSAELSELRNTEEYDFVVLSDGESETTNLVGQEILLAHSATPNSSVGNAYFFVPDNDVFGQYWDRVADRLQKIRRSLNIDGIAVPLPLFEPPIDPAALVAAVASGAGFASVAGSGAIEVPPYRYDFVIFRAQNLAQKVSQYGHELLASIEKRDAETLSLLMNRHEANIQELMVGVREAQIGEITETLLSLEESRRHAQDRVRLYADWLAAGNLAEEDTQIALMSAGAGLQLVGSVLKLVSMIAGFIPRATIGPFIMGIQTPDINSALDSGAEVSQTLGESLSMLGEVFGIKAQIIHMREDWDLQHRVAVSEEIQMNHQIESSRHQLVAAERELMVLHREIEQTAAVRSFMTSKFTDEELYQWMAGQMSSTYYQSYQLALEMARMAERAYQYERGVPISESTFIRGDHWDSRRRGLLAGDQLALDLDRLEQESIKTGERRLEITKKVSLLELDPLAFLQLKQNGSCEFALDEAFFDYEFPGHYGRQVKTMVIDFETPDGATVDATLTQINHQTVLDPDPAAVAFLLDPRDQPPTNVRSDWRGRQQVVLSHHDEYEQNAGLFELRYDSDRYLPFEGTGAVSRWRLELNGKRSTIERRTLLDVVVRLQYTARQGGPVFADAVRGLLRPYPTARFFDMTFDFANAWNDFRDSGERELVVNMTRDQFPDLAGSRIDGVFAHFDSDESPPTAVVINGDDEWTVTNDTYIPTDGLRIAPDGSEISFSFRGPIEFLSNAQFVFTYQAQAR